MANTGHRGDARHRGDDLSVPLDALRKDSGVWSNGAETLHGLSAALEDLTLTITDLSFVAEDTGLLATYRDLQTTLNGLCTQGSAVFSDIAGKLTNAADTFQQEDERCGRRIRKPHR